MSSADAARLQLETGFLGVSPAGGDFSVAPSAGVSHLAPAPRATLALTPFPVRVQDEGPDELRNALEVLDFDELDVVLRVLRLEGEGVELRINLETAMQNESEFGWVTVVSFPVDSAPSAQMQKVTGFLRYVRYRVTDFTGAPAATFSLSGMGRRWGSAG